MTAPNDFAAEYLESQEEVRRLTNIIGRNKASFQKVTAQARRYRDRALAAEAALAEARRSSRPDPGLDFLNAFKGGTL